MKASTRIQQYLSILHFPEILTDSELKYVTGCTREKFEELINEGSVQTQMGPANDNDGPTISTKYMDQA